MKPRPKIAPIKKKPLFILLGIIAFIAIGLLGLPSDQERKEQIAKQDSTDRVEAPARDSLVRLSNDREAAYLTARRLIKNSLNDKNSYEEVSHDTGYVGKKKIYMSSEITYRAKNGFGAMILATTRVDFDKRMNVIRIR